MSAAIDMGALHLKAFVGPLSLILLD